MSSAHHGLDDPVVRAAAAQVLVERLAHLFFTRLLVRGKQRGGSHGNAAHAIAALRGLLGDQRLLHGMELAIAAQTFDSGDLLALDRPDRQVARGDGTAVDQYEAGTAKTAAPAQPAADEPEVVPQHIEERCVAMRPGRSLLAVDRELKHG